MQFKCILSCSLIKIYQSLQYFYCTRLSPNQNALNCCLHAECRNIGMSTFSTSVLTDINVDFPCIMNVSFLSQITYLHIFGGCGRSRSHMLLAMLMLFLFRYFFCLGRNFDDRCRNRVYTSLLAGYLNCLIYGAIIEMQTRIIIMLSELCLILANYITYLVNEKQIYTEFVIRMPELTHLWGL